MLSIWMRIEVSVCVCCVYKGMLNIIMLHIVVDVHWTDNNVVYSISDVWLKCLFSFLMNGRIASSQLDLFLIEIAFWHCRHCCVLLFCFWQGLVWFYICRYKNNLPGISAWSLGTIDVGTRIYRIGVAASAGDLKAKARRIYNFLRLIDTDSKRTFSLLHRIVCCP